MYVDDRTEHADRGQRGGRYCSLHLLGTTAGSFIGCHTCLTVPEDVLQHDDRVVDEHAHTQRQTAQAHDVERDPGKVQQCKRRDHRDRYSECYGNRIPRMTQEEEQHQEREYAPEDQRLDHVGDRVGNEPRLAHRYIEVHFGVLGPELIQYLVDAIRHPHRIGARLLEQEQPNGFVTVVPRYGLSVAESVFNRGHVSQQHQVAGAARVVGARAQRHIGDLVDGLKLAQGTQSIRVAAASDPATGCTLISCRQYVTDGLDGEAVAFQQSRIDLDMDLALESARQRRLGHAVDLLQATLEHHLGQVFECGEIGVAGNTHRHDRLRTRIGAQHRGPRSHVG